MVITAFVRLLSFTHSVVDRIKIELMLLAKFPQGFEVVVVRQKTKLSSFETVPLGESARVLLESERFYLFKQGSGSLSTYDHAAAIGPGACNRKGRGGCTPPRRRAGRRVRCRIWTMSEPVFRRITSGRTGTFPDWTKVQNPSLTGFRPTTCRPAKTPKAALLLQFCCDQPKYLRRLSEYIEY